MDQDRFDMNCEGCCILSDTTIDGNLKTDKSVVLYGAILGNVHAVKQVVVNESALIDGDVECAELYLNGQITGNVCVTFKAVLGASAVIKGSLTAACLEITPGAVIGVGLELKNTSK